MSNYLTKQINRALARSENTLSGQAFGRRRIEPRMILKAERRRGVSQRNRLRCRFSYQDRWRNQQGNAGVAMIDDGNRLLRPWVCFDGYVTSLDLLRARERL